MSTVIPTHDNGVAHCGCAKPRIGGATMTHLNTDTRKFQLTVDPRQHDNQTFCRVVLEFMVHGERIPPAWLASDRKRFPRMYSSSVK